MLNEAKRAFVWISVFFLMLFLLTLVCTAMIEFEGTIEPVETGSRIITNASGLEA